jgi:hypothetical protein
MCGQVFIGLSGSNGRSFTCPSCSLFEIKVGNQHRIPLNRKMLCCFKNPRIQPRAGATSNARYDQYSPTQSQSQAPLSALCVDQAEPSLIARVILKLRNLNRKL